MFNRQPALKDHSRLAKQANKRNCLKEKSLHGIIRIKTSPYRGQLSLLVCDKTIGLLH